MDDKKWKVFNLVSILVIIILISNIKAIKKSIQVLDQRSLEIENRLIAMESNFKSSINYLGDSIHESMNDLIDYEVNYNELDLEAETVEVTFKFKLKHMGAESVYDVNYTAVDHGDLEGLEFKDKRAAYIGGTSYKCNISLPLKYNYSFNIIEKSKDGGMNRLYHADINKPVYDDFYINRTYSYNHGYTGHSNEIDMHFTINNNTFGRTEFKIKKVELELYSERTLVYRDDITNNYSYETYSNSEENNPGSYYETGPISDDPYGHLFSSDTKTVVRRNYYATIPKEKLIEEFPDIFMDIEEQNSFIDLLDRKIIVTYENGEEIVLY